MNKAEMESYYYSHQKLIASVAWKMSAAYPVEIDELISQGNLIFMETLHRYQKDRAKFSTFLTQNLYQHLTEFCQQETNWAVASDSSDIEMECLSYDSPGPEELTISKQNFDSRVARLNPDSQMIMEHIFSPDMLPGKLTKKNIMEHMLRHHSMTKYRSSRTLRDIHKVMFANYA